jgi:hypothetical protein
MWFQVELPQPTTIAELQIDSAPSGGGRFGAGFGGRGGGGRGRGGVPPGFGPYGYKVQVSMDGSAWTDVAQGAGSTPSTVIALTPVRAKYVRVTQTGTAPNGEYWGIAQFRIFQVGKPQ